MNCHFRKPDTLWKRAACYTIGIPVGTVLFAGACIAIPVTLVGGFMLADVVSNGRVSKYMDDSNCRDIEKYTRNIVTRPPLLSPVIDVCFGTWCAFSCVGAVYAVPGALKFFKELWTDYLASRDKTCCTLIRRGMLTPMNIMLLIAPITLAPFCGALACGCFYHAYIDTCRLLK
jgi:hypothetical protein